VGWRKKKTYCSTKRTKDGAGSDSMMTTTTTTMMMMLMMLMLMLMILMRGTLPYENGAESAAACSWLDGYHSQRTPAEVGMRQQYQPQKWLTVLQTKQELWYLLGGAPRDREPSGGGCLFPD